MAMGGVGLGGIMFNRPIVKMKMLVLMGLGTSIMMMGMEKLGKLWRLMSLLTSE